MRVYVDTNPYIDVFEDRKNHLLDLGELSFQMFRRIRENKYELVVSDWLEKELENNEHLDEYEDFIKELGGEGVKIYKTETDIKDKEEANKYQNKADALHAILARKMNADILITRNDKDFIEVQDIIEIGWPREL